MGDSNDIMQHQGHTGCIHVLLGADSVDNYGDTALHGAAAEGHVECICALLERGANIQSGNNYGNRALHVAASEGHVECICALLDRGADIDSENLYFDTALHVAASKGHVECIRALLDRGAVDSENLYCGDTALHYAALKGHLECLGLLLDRGADIYIENRYGRTALHLAASEGHLECIYALLDRGADIDSKNNNCWTALHYAAQKGHNDCIRLLLDRQAIIDEDKIDDIEHQECKQMIIEEIQHRLRRAAFDSFINHHIEYLPFISVIYSICYPSGDLRVAAPQVGWPRAEAVRNKYYFDEILFHVHMHVANVLLKSRSNSRKTLARYSQFKDYLAKNNNDTSTLMTVLSDRLKEYLKPN